MTLSCKQVHRPNNRKNHVMCSHGCNFPNPNGCIQALCLAVATDSQGTAADGTRSIRTHSEDNHHLLQLQLQMQPRNSRMAVPAVITSSMMSLIQKTTLQHTEPLIPQVSPGNQLVQTCLHSKLAHVLSVCRLQLPRRSQVVRGSFLF